MASASQDTDAKEAGAHRGSIGSLVPASPRPAASTQAIELGRRSIASRNSVTLANPAVLVSFTLDAEGKCEECSNGFKSGGAAACSLFGREYGEDPSREGDSDKRASFLFTKEIDQNMQAGDPTWSGFWKSHQGAFIQFGLIFLYMHFDAGLPILQELYKKFYGKPTFWIEDLKLDCSSYDVTNCLAHGCALTRKNECFEKSGLLYTKQSLLITQNFCEILCIFLLARYLRGSFKDCINLQKTVKFAPAGACFGIQAVFGFFAMEEMGADAYSLYAQASIIVLTVAWSIIFRVKLSGPVWIGVLTIVVGMIGFNMSDATTTVKGLTFISLKIVCQCFACIYAELFMKTDPEVLYIQMAWIKPVEMLVTIVMTVFMSTAVKVENVQFIDHVPRNTTALEAISELGYFHHWSWLTVVIMIFNMGDTFMTATVAKKFDSVVKGVAGVADIIYPTQFLMYFIKRPDYNALMLISGIVIILGALNFVLAKGAMRRTQARKDEIAGLKAELGKSGGYGATSA